MTRLSRPFSSHLAAPTCAVLLHGAVAVAAFWISSAPKAAPEPPRELRVKLALAPEIDKPIDKPQDLKPEPPKPEPAKPEQQANREPSPQPPAPSPTQPPLPEVSSTAAESDSARQAPAPVAAPPPPPRDSSADQARKADYFAHLLGWLDRHKDYPRDARKRREQGVAQLYFRMNRDGRVLSYRLDASSGHAALDAAALRMIERANPLPSFPPEISDAELELVVPVEFFLKRRR